MTLGKLHLRRLQKLVYSAQKLVTEVEAELRYANRKRRIRKRRSRSDAAVLRKAVRADRKKGIPARKIAESRRISINYVYLMLR
jgi:hypothetical protein